MGEFYKNMKILSQDLFKKTATITGGMSHSKSKTAIGATSVKTTLGQTPSNKVTFGGMQVNRSELSEASDAAIAMQLNINDDQNELSDNLPNKASPKFLINNNNNTTTSDIIGGENILVEKLKKYVPDSYFEKYMQQKK